jgi:hypothetical protein
MHDDPGDPTGPRVLDYTSPRPAPTPAGPRGKWALAAVALSLSLCILGAGLIVHATTLGQGAFQIASVAAVILLAGFLAYLRAIGLAAQAGRLPRSDRDLLAPACLAIAAAALVWLIAVLLVGGPLIMMLVWH